MKRRPDIGPFLQLRMAPNHWVTMKLRTGGFQPGKWQQITQPIPRLHARIRFTPAGRGGWRVRFLPSEAGGHKVKLTFRGRGRGVRRGRGGFPVAAGRSDGVVRLARTIGPAQGQARKHQGVATGDCAALGEGRIAILEVIFHSAGRKPFPTTPG